MAFDVTAILKANVSQFTGPIKEAQSVFESFKSKSNRSFEAIADGFQKVGAGMTAGFTAPIAAGFGAAIKSASNFEDGIAKMTTLFDTSKKDVGELKKEFIDLSNQLGMSTNDLTEAGYQAMSAGIDVHDASDFVTKAGKLAKAGFTTTATAVDVLTTALNAYGKGQDEAEGIANKLVRTQNLGKTTVDELASSMGDVIPVASAMGVDIDNLTSAYVSLTKQGIATAKATTATKNLFGELGKSSSDVAKILKEKTGKSFKDLMNDGNTVADVLKILDNHAKETGQGFNDLWSSQEAGSAAMALLNGGVDEFNQTVETMKSNTDDVGDAIEKLMTPSEKAKIAMNQLKNAGTLFGETMLSNLGPAIETITGKIQQFSDWFSNLSEDQKLFIAKIGLAVAAIGPMLLAISGVMKAMGTLKSVFSGIGAVLSNPWGLAIVAIVALVAGLVHAYKNSETFRNIVNSAVTAVVNKFNELREKAQPALDFIKQALGKLNLGAFAPLIGGVGLAILALSKLKNFKLTNPLNIFKSSPVKIPNPFTGLANMAKAAGTAVKNAFTGLGSAISSIFKGIGSAVSTAFQGIARAISSLNPVGVASFALALAAVVAALVALSAVQDMVLPFLQGLADIFLQLVGGVLEQFVSALVGLSPIMTTLASALAMLSPLIVAFGVAFSMVAEALGGAIAEIIAAITPIVQIVGDVFVQVVQIVTDAIVQIVQALAPFIPAVTEMVVALAPVLSQIVEAFNNLISQISPILDSLAGLFESFGEAVKTVLDGVKGIIESIGGVIRSALDGVAGIFDSMGNAAKNAGQGVKLMAQGIKILVDLKLGDLVGTLAAVATGLGAIASSGIATAGPGLQAAGMGMQMMATSAQMASIAIQLLPTALTTLSASLGTLPSMMSVAGTAMMAFATSAQTSVLGLTAIGAIITQFASMMMAIAPASAVAVAGLSAFNGQASSAGSAMQRLGTASSQALSQVTALGAGISSSMSNATSSIANAGAQMSTAIRSSGSQMVTTMQSSMNQVKSVVLNGMTASSQAVQNGGSQMTTAIRQAGTQMVTITQSTMSQMKSIISNGMSAIVSSVRSGSSQMVSAWRSSGNEMVTVAQTMVNQTVSTIRSGYGNMQSAGAYIGEGVASGMRSALDSVTAAANAIISKANEAARAAAKIHSPSRLFRDQVGYWIGAGIAVGIENTSRMVENSFGFIQDIAKDFVSNTSSILDDVFMIPDMATDLMSNLTVSHSPQSVQHSIDNVASEQRLLKKFDELLEETKKGRFMYLDGREVGRIMDRRLGQHTQIRSRTSWA